MFLKPNAVVYVRRSGLIVAGKHVKPVRLNFPEEVVNNLEVIQVTKFTAVCEQFFGEHGLHGKRVLIVLDPSVVFTKTVDLSKSGKPDQIAQAFSDAMPFEPGQRSCVALANQAQLQLYATNADLYESLATALRGCGISKLLGITPAAAYQLQEGKLQLGIAMQQFVANTKVRQNANFADAVPS
jgi:hypothetical protein